MPPAARDTPVVGAAPVADSLERFTDSTAYYRQLERVRDNPYESVYPTKLKGGFSIAYGFNTEDQYLLYKKGERVLDTIGGGSLGLIYKNLGYVAEDFDHTFVFAHSFGSGNPHYIQLLEKETLRNLIPDGSAWIDVDTVRQLLLYSPVDVPEPGDSMTLFDTRSRAQRSYPFPKEIFDGPQVLNRIRLLGVTEKTFTIEYEYGDEPVTKKKTYRR
ncbi:hypothetical protein [Flaviaesturariibacter terrae]